MAKLERKATDRGLSAVERRQSSRYRRFAAQRALHKLSSQVGVRRCMSALAGNVSVSVVEGIAHVGGVFRCGSAWSCPVCAPTVREHRAREIDEAVSAHLDGGGGAFFVTLTVPHDAGEDLRRLTATVVEGLRWVQRHWNWKQGPKTRLGVLGQIKALEYTYGANGWHPHLHNLLVTECASDTAGAVEDLRATIGDLWRQWCLSQGRRPPSKRWGVDVRPVGRNSGLGEYLTKVDGGWSVGLELARGDLKRAASSTPISLLGEFLETGDVEVLALWNDYERGTYGRSALRWSPGLRARLGAGADLDDVEVCTLEAAAEAGALVVFVPAQEWAAMRANGTVAAFLCSIEARWERERGAHSGAPPPLEPAA